VRFGLGGGQGGDKPAGEAVTSPAAKAAKSGIRSMLVSRSLSASVECARIAPLRDNPSFGGNAPSSM